MTIGERIKFHRKARKMTQSQLAEILDVSVQAISKWETNGGLPDLSQIVPLARVLNITTDELLAHGNRQEDFNNLWKETLETFGDDPERLYSVSRAALEVFPNDEKFLFRIAVDEERLSELPQNQKRKDYLLGQAIFHAEKLLRINPDHESAKQLISSAYAKLGNYDAAKEAAYKCKDVDTALKSCLKGDELRRHRQKIIDKSLKNLLKEMLWEDISSLDAAERLILSLFPDGNLLYYYGYLMGISIRRGEYYLSQNRTEEAKASFYSAFEYAKKDDAITPRENFFTESFFDLLSYKKSQLYPSAIEQLITCIPKNEFPDLRLEVYREFIIQKGFHVENGLSDDEFAKIQEVYGIEIPKDLKIVLKSFLPLSPDDEYGFPNWRDFSDNNVKKLKERINQPKERILNDVEYGFWCYQWGEKPDDIHEAMNIAREQMELAPKMIPIYSHRYMPVFDSEESLPIFSTIGRDTIVYGNDIFEYIFQEFADVRFPKSKDSVEIPFWSILAE